MSTAHFGVHVAQAEFENMVRLRVLEAATLFYDSLEAKGLLDVARQNVQSLHELEELTKQAIADGGRPAIEAHRIRLDAIAAEQRLRKAAALERGAIARLRAIMGGADLPITMTPIGEMEVSDSGPILTTEEALAIARQARPDLQSILWQRTRAESDVDLQRRLGRAEVAPSFGYTRQYQQKAIGFPDADSWSAALSMTLPIYNRNQGNVAKASAEERRNRFAYAAALLDVEAEIIAASADLKAAEENAVSVAKEQLQLAESVRDSITEAFKNGGRPLIDVLDSQRNYRETYALYVSVRAEYWRALYRYYAVLGQRVNVNE
jgi:cobalt-zinc-cadmium efflux system outer membrane protein